MESFPKPESRESYIGAAEKYFDYFQLTPEDLQKSLLDVGTHTGEFIKYVREVLGNKNAWGVEYQKHKVGPISEGIFRANGLRLPFKDGEFELVLAKNYVPMFYKDRPKHSAEFAVQEMLRVLKPGGRLMFNALTPENLKEDEELQEPETQEWLKKRSIYSTKFFEYLDALKEKGVVISERKIIGTSIFTIQK